MMNALFSFVWNIALVMQVRQLGHSTTWAFSTTTTSGTQKLRRVVQPPQSQPAWLPRLHHRHADDCHHATVSLAAAKKQQQAGGSAATLTKSTNNAAGKVLQQKVALDGGLWISIRNRLRLEYDNQTNKKQEKAEDRLAAPWKNGRLGYAVITTGSINGQRICALKNVANENDGGDNDKNQQQQQLVVALDQDAKIQVYKESIAKIPDSMDEEAALDTYLQSLSLHCVLPVIANVGGSDDSSPVLAPQNGTVVIMGGNEYATWAANTLTQAMQCQVTLVTEKLQKADQVDTTRISVVKPSNAEGESFSNNLQFDSLLDTIFDEQDDISNTNGILGRLKQQHGCQTYVSTMPRSQSLIIEQGLLWGPGKTKDHAKQLQSNLSKRSKSQLCSFPSPHGLGNTVERILEAGCVPSFSDSSSNPSDRNSIHVRGWSLKDFWEYTTWPREAGTNVRFGLPVNERLNKWLALEDDEEEEEEDGPMISAPPLAKDAVIPPPPEAADEFLDKSDPHVVGITSVRGLQRIFQDEMDCVLFLSAPFCRTCRYLKPKYQRMARKYSDDKEYENFVFCKAEAPGATGKELGKALAIDAVPAFVLFKKGRRYGKPLTMTRLPSKKLELAISYLQQGKEWNEEAIDSSQDDRGFEGGTGQARRGQSSLL